MVEKSANHNKSTTVHSQLEEFEKSLHSQAPLPPRFYSPGVAMELPEVYVATTKKILHSRTLGWRQPA